MDMYVIKGAGMGDIHTTANHPFLTDTGWKLAGELTVADKIATGDGVYVVDNEVQGNCVSGKYETSESTFVPEIQAECEMLQKMFGESDFS